MFRVGKVLNCYQKIGVTIVEISGSLTVGDKIKIYKDGECLLTQEITEIRVNQTKIPFAKPKDVVALVLINEVPKGSEIYKISQLGDR